MSTIFTHLLLYVWVCTQGFVFFFFACLTRSQCCSNLFWSLSIVFFYPPSRVSFGVVIVPTSKERISKPAAEASEPKRKIFSFHVWFVHAFIQGHLTASSRWESALCFIVLIARGCKYAKAGCQDCFALPELCCSPPFVCANECMACLSSKLACTTEY